MATRALTFGFGGYADLDVTFGEFFHGDHTVMVRFMPQHPYAGPGPMLAANGGGTYVIGQGEYRDGSGDFKTLGPSTLMVQVGTAKAVYEVAGFPNQVGGPVGYRDVWQHLAVVRQGNGIRLYLNGQVVLPYPTGIELTVPAAGLPSNGTPLRLGRRSPGNSDPNRFWQFYGLVLRAHRRRRHLHARLQCGRGRDLGRRAAHGLGARPSRRVDFDTGVTAPALSRPVTLPTAADLPQDLTAQAAHPVPVYYVGVSADRNSAADRGAMDRRPSKVSATLPFAAGQWWMVTQGRESPQGSHNGATAAFALDLIRTNGVTAGSVFLAAAPGRLLYRSEDGSQEAISAYHAPHERVVYMHLAKGSVAEHFPGLGAEPQDLPPASQPAYAALDPLGSVDAGENHLHFTISAIVGDTIAGAGGGLPVELAEYYMSGDEGQSWAKVAHGVPAPGDWIARYPWSPWGAKGEVLEVAPAVASRASNRLDVFVRGEDDRLWVLMWDGQRWGTWEDMGAGRLTSAPAASTCSSVATAANSRTGDGPATTDGASGGTWGGGSRRAQPR